MSEKLTHHEKSKEFIQPRPIFEIPYFGQFFKKRGRYDGKLFYSTDKVTYTFVSDNKEVISLHFDKVRKTIFYKGHNLSNFSDLTEEQVKHLALFREVISHDEKANSFLRSFDTTYHAHLKNRKQSK